MTEENNEFKRYQDYNNRFLWHTMKYEETECSLTRIEAEVLYEDIKDEIQSVLGVSDTVAL